MLMGKVNDQFLVENFGRYSQRELAERFKVGVGTINRHIKKLGLRDVDPEDIVKVQEKHKAQVAASPIGGDELKRLYELRDIIYDELISSGGSAAARISKEYREILAAIRAAEGGGSDAQTGAFAELAEAIARGVSGANV